MLKNKIPVPEYLDGAFELYDIVDDHDSTSPDFPIKKIHKRQHMGKIWYREMSVYDRTRMTFQQQDIEITHKLRIPRWSGITAMCVCVIDGQQFKVYSSTTVTDQNGIEETELTLMKPPTQYEVKT